MKLLTESELAAKYRENYFGNKATSRQINYIAALMNYLGWNMEERDAYCRKRNIRFSTLTKKKASRIIKELKLLLLQGEKNVK